MKQDAGAAADLRGHIPRLLERARSLLKLAGGPPDRLAPGELKRATEMVSELHLGLVGERKLAQAQTYDRAAYLGAYLLWWWPQSYARVRAAMSLAPLPFASSASPIRILDLGAGSGPAAIAIADQLSANGARVDALLIDESEASLNEARALAAHDARLTLRTQRADLSKGLPGVAPSSQFDLISAAHLLSELPGAVEERSRFIYNICNAHLSPRGALLVIEPALRETGRALLEVRDRLLAADPSSPNRLRALAPCLTQQSCPALVNPRDWCTAEVSWEAPPHLLQLSRELGLHAEAPLSFAPMILVREVPPPPVDVWRVVGVPPLEKGKKRLFVCADRGRLPVARLDRDANATNAAFDEAARGDLLRLRGLTEKGDGLRLGGEATVEPLGPSELFGSASASSESSQP